MPNIRLTSSIEKVRPTFHPLAAGRRDGLSPPPCGRPCDAAHQGHLQLYGAGARAGVEAGETADAGGVRYSVHLCRGNGGVADLGTEAAVGAGDRLPQDLGQGDSGWQAVHVAQPTEVVAPDAFD